MPSQPIEHYSGAGGYPSSRPSSFQPSPGIQPRLPEPPVSLASCQITLPDILTRDISQAPSDTSNVNQEIAHSYDPAYPPQASIDEQMNYYPTGTSNPGQYNTPHQYPQGYGPGYHQNPQGATPASFHPVQNVSISGLFAVTAIQPLVHQARDTYPQPGANPQWQGHYPNAGFVRSTSWPPQHISQPAPPQHTGHLAPPLLSVSHQIIGQ